ncbi:probable disease resistance protein At1g12290 [Brassica napus]|uniref:probable disease resistance protein At1g12290 n=1 Tax=Brassica napus TaxID=3708 RepID=UPI000872ACFE|nr:probable disease resistance protein At1g12290 [Brassica napus]
MAHGLDLTWLLSVPNLTHLELECLEKVQEEIISEEKKVEEYWSPLLFPCLKKIEVEKCPKLRKLPLSFKSCVGGEELVINYRDDKWFKRVRWEDKATKDRFLPCCEKLLTSYTEGNSS